MNSNEQTAKQEITDLYFNIQKSIKDNGYMATIATGKMKQYRELETTFVRRFGHRHDAAPIR